MNACIIIPVFNRAQTIARTLLSVANSQKISEIIVVDDCSTDNTEKIVRDLSLKKLIYIRLDKKSNGNIARNVAARAATGDILIFLDSDDEFCESRIESLVDFYEKTQAELVVDSFLTEKKGGVTSFIFKNTNLCPADFFEGLVCNAIPLTFSSISVRKDCFFQMGGLDDATLRHQDRDFLFSAISQRKVIRLRNVVDVIKHQSEDSFSRSAVGYMAALSWIASKHHIFKDPKFDNVRKYLVLRSLISTIVRCQFKLFIHNYSIYKKSDCLHKYDSLSVSSYFAGKKYRKTVESKFIQVT